MYTDYILTDFVFSEISRTCLLEQTRIALICCSYHHTPHCHWHGSWTGVCWAEAGSWESRPRGEAPPAAAAHATKSHHISLHSRTFSTTIFRFGQNTTVHDARAVGWERFIVLSLRRARQSYTLNVSQSYTTLHPSACLAILQLRRNPTFPCNSPQICQNLLKGPFSFETQAKPC